MGEQTKKVFHVGITAPTYSSEAITKSFKDVFGDVLYFDWQYHRYNFGTETMQKLLLKEANDYKPDIIFLHFNHNSEVLSLENYLELSNLAFVVTYTEDVRDDISWFKKILHYVGLGIFTNIDDVDELNAGQAVKKAAYLPVSYNDLWYKKQPPTTRNYGEIVFLGNNYVNTNTNFPNAQERQDMVAALKKEFGDKFQAYGRGQENEALNPQQAVECYNNAKIAITHNNFKRKGYQSDRGLNSIGCGCFTILQHYDGILSHFDGYGWDNLQQLIDACNFHLKNEGSRILFADIKYKNVTQNHTWRQRAESIKELIYGQS